MRLFSIILRYTIILIIWSFLLSKLKFKDRSDPISSGSTSFCRNLNIVSPISPAFFLLLVRGLLRLCRKPSVNSKTFWKSVHCLAVRPLFFGWGKYIMNTCLKCRTRMPDCCQLKHSIFSPHRSRETAVLVLLSGAAQS